MALPDTLADLFAVQRQAQLSTPAQDFRRAAKARIQARQLPYQITDEPIQDPAMPPEVRAQWSMLYKATTERPDRQLAERLRLLVEQNPDVAALKNLLFVTYMKTDRPALANNVLEQTLQQHPRYLMGLNNKAHQLLSADDLAGVEALFGGSLTDIDRVDPDRSVFHVSEVAQFNHVMFRYLLAQPDPDPEAAEDRLRLMRDLDYYPIDFLRKQKDQLDRAQMLAGFAGLSDENDNSVTIDGYFRAEDRQTTEPPVFQHSEIQDLYTHGLLAEDNPLPAEKRDTLLALPRASLTADLSAVLLDMVNRFRFFQQQDWNPREQNFACHALLLAAELRADECLDAVLETLRQDDDFRKQWWGDFDAMADFYEPYFRQVLPGAAPALQAFLYEPDINTHDKSLVSTAYAHAVTDDPDSRQAAQNWYSEVLTYFLDHADDPQLLDTDFVGFMLCDVVELKLTELLPLIGRAYARGLVTENIQGDFADVQRAMTDETRVPPYRRPVLSLADQYEQLRDPEAWQEAHPEPKRDIPEFIIPESEWDFLYDDDEEDEEEMPVLPARSLPRPGPAVIAPPKPGRNDKVSVRYTDGTTVQDVKYKKVEADVETGKCVLI